MKLNAVTIHKTSLNIYLILIFLTQVQLFTDNIVQIIK